MKFHIEVPAQVQFIIQKLEKCGYEAYMVGGCVRDNILGRIPHDYDICTSATPDEIIAAFPAQEIIPTGLQHGTVTILINREPYEVTTYRIDGKYTDNRRPDSVEFTNSLTEDLRRRDFTINAMAYNSTNGLVDPFGGIKDIENSAIRCVGSAHNRINEDALRILRAIRLAAQLDFGIAEETDEEIHKSFGLLENISIERVTSEFIKIVSSDSFYIKLMLYNDVFSLFIPELKYMIGFKQYNLYHSYDVFEHTVHALENCESQDMIVRLAVFFHDFGKPHSYQDDEDGIRHFKGHGRVSADMTDIIMRKLRFDNNTREKVVELVYYHDASFAKGKKYVKRWLNKIGEIQFRRLLAVRRADIMGQSNKYEQERLNELLLIESLIDDVITDQDCFTVKDLSVGGKDLISIGYRSGCQIGKTLKQLLELVINEEVENKNDELLELAKRWLNKE